MPDFTREGWEARQNRARQHVEALESLDRNALSDTDRVGYDTLLWDERLVVAQRPFRLLQFPYTPYEWMLAGPDTDFQKFAINSAADAKSYLRLAAGYAGLVSGMARHLEEQERAGIYLQRDAAIGVRSLFEGLAGPFTASPLYVSDDRLKQLSAADRKQFRRRLERLYTTQIVPSLRAFAGRFDQGYLDRSPRRSGLWQYPGGKDYYRLLVRRYMSIEASPEELYSQAQGLLDRSESDARMAQAEVIQAAKRAASPTLPSGQPVKDAATFANLLEIHLQGVRQIESRLFCRPVTMKLEIRRASPLEEASLNYGYADVLNTTPPIFVYFYNGSHINEQAVSTSKTLIYHEIVPGHYTQTATQLAAGAPSGFASMPGRYARDNNGYQEAWAEYAVMAIREEGAFNTPDERLGRAQFEKMFAARALVDIGINYFGKDTQWGQKILDRYSGQTEAQSRKGLLRDTTDWPAQILPYSLGARYILRMREQARFELGERFDLRRFHDAVLGIGAVPLTVLERHIDWFVDQERTGTAPGICTAN